MADAKARAVAEYEASVDFEAKVIEGLAMAYGYRFEDYGTQVKKLFPVDANLLDPKAGGKEAEEGSSLATITEPDISASTSKD